MKLPLLKRDTAAELRKTTDAISQAAAKLAALREERARLLVETDDAATIKRHDDEIAELERHIRALQDRLRGLDVVQRGEHREAREQQKAAALTALEKALRAETDAAVTVVEGFVTAANAYARYKEIVSRPRPWSDLFPSDSYYRMRRSLFGAITDAFYWWRMQEHEITEIPKRAPGLIERLRASGDRCIADLRAEPLPRSALQPEPEEAANG